MDVPMLLTIKDLVSQFQVKPSTLYSWVAQGKIPCLRLNGLVRFSKEEIDAWVDASRKKAVTMKPRQTGGGYKGDLKAYIARLRRAGHNGRRGETGPKSGLIGKEETDGAL